MPKRTTTAALSILSKNNQGEILVRLNAKAASGSTIVESSVDWGDDEVEQVIESLPANASHAYMIAGEHLIIFTVKDSENNVISEGLNVFIEKEIIPPSVEIIGVFPDEGSKGIEIEIRGLNFGSEQGETKLTMDTLPTFASERLSQPMTVKSWSDTRIIAVIP